MFFPKYFSLWKTLYFNFKHFPPREAFKLPVYISKNVVIKSTVSTIKILHRPLSKGMIKIGFGDVGIFDKQKSRSIWHFYGNVTFAGYANLGHGTKISGNGNLVFGHNFNITAETSIVCNHEITFGNDVLFSWECLVMDTDFHKVIDKKLNCINKDKPIIIGDRVWIGCRCTILKGSVIGNDTVIAANTAINKPIETSNVIIAGNPTNIVKENITWSV